MAYIRTTMMKSDLAFKDSMKNFRGGDGEKMLKAAGAEWIHIVQTGDHSGMMISCFATKTQANKAWKKAAGLRADALVKHGSVFWPVEGTVRWST